MERWVEETLHGGFRVRLKADRVLFDSDTEHQRLIIFDNAEFGRVMMLDGVVQLATKDDFIYHEMMAHVPLFAHGQAKRALIVGWMAFWPWSLAWRVAWWLLSSLWERVFHRLAGWLQKLTDRWFPEPEAE